MTQDTPRDTAGAKLCAWCGSPIQQSAVGRSRDYCRRSCRQRAYEARKQREAVVAAVASAVVRRDSSRDETRDSSDPSRDETKPQVKPSAPPAPRQRWKWSGLGMQPEPLWEDEPPAPTDPQG